MEEEKINNHRDILLSKEGKRIQDFNDVTAGDILSIFSLENLPHGPNEIRLYYVNSIEHEPKFFNTPMEPYVSLKRPHIGVRFSKPSLEDCYVHLSIPSSGDKCRECWNPKEDKKEHVYLLKSGILYEWGKLIPNFELPNWSFLFQSGKSSRLISLCESTKGDFEKARQIYEKIKTEFEKHTRK
ncbi:MAG: hypothetical protein PHX96_03090 [Candidatus Nanoarchaeia archaeon]|nr:hypothetical protein [Candidatus Nanoarchaeia archaeon]